MDYIEGTPLKGRRRGPRIRIRGPDLENIRSSASQRISHRDLKPENILVTRALAVSPDGRNLVGLHQLWIQPFDSEISQLLPSKDGYVFRATSCHRGG